MSTRNFGLIGVGGYIAPRHLQAIKETGHVLKAALDKHDSVGILDRYFPDASFFTEFERFDRHVEKLRQKEDEAERLHYVSICSPNYLHDAHMRFALRIGAHAICEKPLVLNPWNLDAISELEKDSPGRVFSVLQLRLHEAIIALKKKVAAAPNDKVFDVDLTYITSRGSWYGVSWKGDDSKSGGVTTNIGIHFFDMLMWVFGPVQSNRVYVNDPQKAAGFLELERARVRWFLSVDAADLPEPAVQSGQRTYRSISVDHEEVEFSQGFTDLHTLVYRDVLEGGGFSLEDARPSIQLSYDIRHAATRKADDGLHPLAAGAKKA